MRHRRVSGSPSNLAALAIGIALANVSTKASNNSVKPDPARAQGVATLRAPSSDSSLAAHARATACDAGRNPDAATFHPSCREPRNPRARTRRRRTGSRAENPHTNRADHPRPQIRYASPSTATATQGPTGKDRCLASPHNKLDPNRSLPKPTQKTALPTPFSEEPRSCPSWRTLYGRTARDSHFCVRAEPNYIFSGLASC